MDTTSWDAGAARRRGPDAWVRPGQPGLPISWKSGRNVILFCLKHCCFGLFCFCAPERSGVMRPSVTTTECGSFSHGRESPRTYYDPDKKSCKKALEEEAVKKADFLSREKLGIVQKTEPRVTGTAGWAIWHGVAKASAGGTVPAQQRRFSSFTRRTALCVQGWSLLSATFSTEKREPRTCRTVILGRAPVAREKAHSALQGTPLCAAGPRLPLNTGRQHRRGARSPDL